MKERFNFSFKIGGMGHWSHLAIGYILDIT